MSEKKNPLGPVGHALCDRIRELRGRMTYRELSERLTELGRPIPPLGLSRLENGDRRVDVDDLVTLAAAFGVDAAELISEAGVPAKRTLEQRVADLERRLAQ